MIWPSGIIFTAGLRNGPIRRRQTYLRIFPTLNEKTSCERYLGQHLIILLDWVIERTECLMYDMARRPLLAMAPGGEIHHFRGFFILTQIASTNYGEPQTRRPQRMYKSDFS